MADWCIHAANILYLVSYLTRDMMWLRLLTCAGLALGIVFFVCQPSPLYAPCVWQVLFFVINVVQIRRLIRERRRVKLSEDREQVAREAFKDLSRDEMLNLLTRAMCAQAERLPDLRKAAREPLSEDEQIVRDIAFRGLSNKELLNLLTRRLWTSLWWINPTRWRLRGTRSRSSGPEAKPRTAPPRPLSPKRRGGKKALSGPPLSASERGVRGVRSGTKSPSSGGLSV